MKKPKRWEPKQGDIVLVCNRIRENIAVGFFVGKDTHYGHESYLIGTLRQSDGRAFGQVNAYQIEKWEIELLKENE